MIPGRCSLSYGTQMLLPPMHVVIKYCICTLYDIPNTTAFTQTTGLIQLKHLLLLKLLTVLLWRKTSKKRA